MRRISLLLYLKLLLNCYFLSAEPLFQKLNFTNPNAERIWGDPQILGNSTHFEYPLSMGTNTECDAENMRRAFDSNFVLHDNYTSWNDNWGLDDIAARYYARGYGFKLLANADLKIESETVSVSACFGACITMKDFVCREFDFYKDDRHICSLFKINGVFTYTAGDTNFIGRVPSSDHYTLWKSGDTVPQCNLTDDKYAYPYFALGWKAMEAGWYELARDQFTKAIKLDKNYYMAHIGMILSNENFGHSLSDDVIGSYKDKIVEISQKPDRVAKFTNQQLLNLKAFVALHSEKDLKTGLAKMIEVYNSDATKTDYVNRVLLGNANLLGKDLFGQLESQSTNNVFALHYLTHNLNPYRNGQNRRSLELRDAAIKAIFNYQALKVDGAWRITEDCVDIAEYYSRWAVGKERLEAQRIFLFKNTGKDYLFYEDEFNIMVSGLDVKYMSKSLKRINDYERYHFYLLQMGLYDTAMRYLKEREENGKSSDDEERKNLRMRMKANAYFSTYDYIYDKYAQAMEFSDDWKAVPGNTTNDLTLATRSYYWAAAAVQKIRSNKLDEAGTILSSLKNAQTRALLPQYKDLILIYVTVVEGTLQEKTKKYDDAYKSAKEAGNIQKRILNAVWAISNNSQSLEFRLLIPIGYQFQADMIRNLKSNPDAPSAIRSLANEDIADYYKLGVETPPLNTSRLLKGYGDSLMASYGNTPKRKGEEHPPHIQVFDSLLKAWQAPDVSAEEFPLKSETLQIQENYFNRPITFCETEKFQIRSEAEICWGGYLIIGICVAIAVIILIVVGIVCLRKKARAPQKDKENQQAFIFSGPDLTARDDNESTASFHMSTLRRGGGGSSDILPYASQTLDIKRNFNTSDADYTNRSHTMGTRYNDGYSAH